MLNIFWGGQPGDSLTPYILFVPTYTPICFHYFDFVVAPRVSFPSASLAPSGGQEGDASADPQQQQQPVDESAFFHEEEAAGAEDPQGAEWAANAGVRNLDTSPKPNLRYGADIE